MTYIKKISGFYQLLQLLYKLKIINQPINFIFDVEK